MTDQGQIQQLQAQLKSADAMLKGHGEAASVLHGALVQAKAECALLRERVAELEAAQSKPNDASEQTDKAA